MNAQVLSQKSSSVKVLVILIAFLFVLLVLQPFLWGMVKRRALALHERRTLTEQIKETEIRTMDIRNKYDIQSIYIKQLASVIPSSALQVIERLETATQGLGVQVEVSRIDEGASLKSSAGIGVGSEFGSDKIMPSAIALDNKSKSNVFPLHITLVATGSSQALVEYIDAVEHVQELSMIQKFTISPGTTRFGQAVDQDQNGFQLLMTVVFYLQDNNGTKE